MWIMSIFAATNSIQSQTTVAHAKIIFDGLRGVVVGVYAGGGSDGCTDSLRQPYIYALMGR